MSQEIFQFSDKDVRSTLKGVTVYADLLDRLGFDHALVQGVVARKKLQVINQMWGKYLYMSRVTVWTLHNPSDGRRALYVSDVSSASGKQQLVANTIRIGNLLNNPLGWRYIPGLITELTEEGIKNAT